MVNVPPLVVPTVQVREVVYEPPSWALSTPSASFPTWAPKRTDPDSEDVLVSVVVCL